MPRRSKGPRLWLRPGKRGRGGKVIRRATWIILDGNSHIATGCLESETADAQIKLASYLGEKYQPSRTQRELEEIVVADVLLAYDEAGGARNSNRAQFDGRLERLNEFWGARKLSEVTGKTCREFVLWRRALGGARRDLEDLRAAINHHAKEGLHHGTVRVVLPPRGPPRTRWLTRGEVAKLLWVCWRAQEIQSVHRGPHKGQKIKTDRRPLRHLARFILIGLYTGTRAAAIASASLQKGADRSFVDLERGIYYRLPEGRRETNKRQPLSPSRRDFSRIFVAGKKKVSHARISLSFTDYRSSR